MTRLLESSWRKEHKQKAMSLGQTATLCTAKLLCCCFKPQFSHLWNEDDNMNFQGISHLKQRTSSKVTTQRVAQGRIKQNPCLSSLRTEGSQGEKAKRNNRMVPITLLKLLKWQFLKKGRKCPHCEWERRKAGESQGRRAVLMALRPLLTPSWAWPKWAGQHLWIWQFTSSAPRTQILNFNHFKGRSSLKYIRTEP